MNYNIPKFVKTVLDTLKLNDFEAYIVGGSVRDILMGKEPFDFDVTTNALPEQVINIFEKTIPTGIKHGTVTVIIDGNAIEVTTYRTDNAYSDSRHPESVLFVSSIKDDLSRRDFTVNAIAYNDENGIYDPFNGIDDINNKLLKTVGNPKERFNEDALRILRLFRFASQLDFVISEETLIGAIETATGLKNISRERIRDELLKTLCGKNPFVLNTLIKSNSLNFLQITKESYIPDMICNIPSFDTIRLSYFCLVNNIDIIKICRILKTSKAFMEECDCICELYKKEINTKINIKLILSETKLEYFKSYLMLYESINNSKNITSLLYQITENNEPYKIDMLAVKGDDLINLGFSGKQIGEKLQELLRIVIEDPKMNDRTKLLKLL